MVELMLLPISTPFSKKDGDLSGTFRVSKFRIHQGWYIECSIWPPTSGRRIMCVPASLNKKGWLVFWEMIKDFRQKIELDDSSFKNFSSQSEVSETFDSLDDQLARWMIRKGAKSR